MRIVFSLSYLLQIRRLPFRFIDENRDDFEITTWYGPIGFRRSMPSTKVQS